MRQMPRLRWYILYLVVGRIAPAALLLAVCMPAFALPAAESPAGIRVVKFGPKVSVLPRDVFLSDGSRHSEGRSFGWDQDLTRQTRDRGDGCTGIALLDSGISQATFTINLPDGDYLVTVTASDTQYAGTLAVVLDGELAAVPMPYAAGQSATLAVPVKSASDKASITFVGGREGVGNCLLSSIRIIPALAEPDKWRAANNAVDAYRERVRSEREEKAARKRKARQAYTSLTVTDSRAPRQVVDLGGKWLFSPTSDLKQAETGPNPSQNDGSWHVMNVPEFWKPIEWWIYFAGAATSHDFYRDEIDRCDQLTFDYKTTGSGWYRHWIDVPASMKGRRFVLRFDAVASVAQVCWNGEPVGSHVGMFGPFECEVTPRVRFGERNLLAVYVSSGRLDPNLAKGRGEVAVTVNITPEMLNSLAHGCYAPGMAGIWQPVSLIVTGSRRIQDVIFRPRLNGAAITATVSSHSKAPLTIKHAIIDAATGRTLYEDREGRAVRGEATTIDTGTLRPKLWSPEHPNLYVLKTRLLSAGKIVDEVSTTVGFKTFEARGNRLYLNGKPYFLRGADMPPHGLKPNDKALADKFMKTMHDGNTMATRFHVAPPSQIWLDAADRYGVGASVGENWPWILMGSNPIPDRGLIDLWHKEFLEVVRANRNHPSLMMWTISNESYFEADSDPQRRVEKYRIFSDLIEAVRKEDPQTPIVFHSGHVRTPAELPMLAANKLDDGDIDDAHFYFGWYTKSPFAVNVASDIEKRGTGTRPLISQEASTGYPDNDTGHPVETYIVNHGVPQAWVGSHALYSSRPDMFLETHAAITKEYAEKIRRERTSLSGWMLFANCCWFADVYDAERIAPYPVYWAVQKAWQPVLVSLDSPNRHFAAGQEFASDIFVVNDDPDRPVLRNLTLIWRVRDQSNDETRGRESFPDCRFDGKCRKRVEFTMPAKLRLPRSNVTLELELRSGDEIVSRNDYALVCADESFCRVAAAQNVIVLENDSKTSEYLASAGAKCESRDTIDWTTLAKDSLVVIGPGVGIGSAEEFAEFIRSGGRALIVAPTGGSPALSAIPEFDAAAVKTVDASGDFVEPLAPELLDGLDPMDMHWWNAEPGDTVRVCRFSYQLPEGEGVTLLARHVQPHGYVRSGRQVSDYTSWPAFEARRGGGKVIVTSLLMADDPIARRFWSNLISYLAR